MRLGKKRSTTTVKSTTPTITSQHTEAESTAPQGDPTLPGIAGYRGIAPVPKNGMPVSRFNYVRPDRRGRRR